MDYSAPKTRLGYGEIIGTGQTKEFDTVTCFHCNRVWVIRSTEKNQGNPGGWCRQCMKAICPQCADLPCLPMERRLKEYEDKARFAREAGLELR